MTPSAAPSSTHSPSNASPLAPDLQPTTELDAHRHRETVDQPPRALRPCTTRRRR